MESYYCRILDTRQILFLTGLENLDAGTFDSVEIMELEGEGDIKSLQVLARAVRKLKRDRLYWFY